MSKSGTPRYVSYGAEDLSSVLELPEVPEKGTVILNTITYAEKGPQFALVNGKTIGSVFGEKFTTTGSDFFNHQNKFLRQWCSRGSSAFVERILGKDCNNPANLIIYIDVLKDVDLKNYLRDSFGNYIPDGFGDYMVDPITPTIKGMKIRFVKVFRNDKTDLPSLGSLKPIAGTMKDANDKVSTMYPFIEWSAKYRGRYYNDIGFSLSSYNQYEIDVDNLKNMKSLMYGFKLYKREDGSTTPKITKTLLDMNFLDVALKKNAKNPNTSALVALDSTFVNSYYKESGTGLRYQDTNGFFVYHNYLDMILGLVKESEKEHISKDMATWGDGLTDANLNWFDYNSDTLEGDEYLINIFTCTSTKGAAYYTVELDNEVPTTLPENTSIVSFSNNTPIFLSGGSDGEMTLDDLNQKTKEILNEYADQSTFRVNNIKFPGMLFVDSGYPLEVKKAAFNFITVRPETAIINSTEIYDDLANRRYNAANSIGIARALSLRAMLAPESVYFNTDVIRAAMVLGSFDTTDEVEYTAQTFEIMDYISEMMGGTKWKKEKLFDSKCYGRHGVNYYPDAVTEPSKDALWDLGLIVPEITNRTKPKYIGLCTMYPNGSSIANNIFTMLALCNCERLAKDSYLEVGGDVSKPNALFIKDTTDDLTKRHKDVFAGIFKTRVEITILGRDARYGNTYTAATHLSGNVAKTGCYHSTKLHRIDPIEG